MIAPGQMFEIERAVTDNRVYRVWKNLWSSIRDFWRVSVAERPNLRDNVYLVYEDTRITYGEADTMVQKLVSIFREVSPNLLFVLHNNINSS